MKKTLYTLILVLTFSFINAQDNSAVKKINWVDIEKAQELNSKEPKKIIIDLYTNWCGWCKKMDVTTFQHPKVVDYINKNYYAVKLNAETRDTIQFNNHTFVNPNASNVRRPTHEFASIGANNGRLSFPTIVYLDEELNRLSVVPGYQTPEGLEPIITYFGENHYKTTTWEEFLASFKGKISK